jgi:hypothetical protein
MAPDSEHTPRPGTLLSASDADLILPQFLAKYRVKELNNIPSNLPTACTLDGIEDNRVFESEQFLSTPEVLVLFEYPREVFVASPEGVLDFIRSKEPWEDHDICVFPRDLAWCVGLTHNEKIFVVDKHEVLRGKR